MVAFIILSQLFQLRNNVLNQTPMQAYNFHQGGILFSQKKEIVELIYQQAGGQPFMLGVLGTPYGVQTVWTTVFEQYLEENQAYRPTWYGFQALGFPGDSFFTKTDDPAPQLFLIVENNYQALLSPGIIKRYLNQVNAATSLENSWQLHGFTIEKRLPLQD